jgi:DNA polymerase-1
VSRERAQEVADTTRRVMEAAAQLSVPLVVDVGIGNNWAEIH